MSDIGPAHMSQDAYRHVRVYTEGGSREIKTGNSTLFTVILDCALIQNIELACVVFKYVELCS